nr:hypothetical protein [Tanacetum cinerariifolium]
MSVITDVKCALTQKVLDALCNKFHIPEELHLFFLIKMIRCTKGLLGKLGCTLEMDIFAFIHTSDHNKVKMVEQEHNKGEPLFLETTIGHTVLLLLVAPDHAESEPDASLKRLFDEGGSGNQTKQVDSTGGGKDADIQHVIKATDTVVEDVAPVQPKRQGKRKSVDVDAGGASHPPKKLKEDYGTPSETSVNGKSRSALKRLLAGVVLNVEVGVAAMPTFPFMTASISSTLEREDSSHHSGINVAEAEVDSLIRSSVSIMTTVTTITSTIDHALVTKKKLVKPSSFCVDSSSSGGTDPTKGVFSDLTGSDFLVGAIRTVINPDTDLQKVYVPQ